MNVITGIEAKYLLEARLDHTYTGELTHCNNLIQSWHKGSTQEHAGIFSDELKRALRKLSGFWSRCAAVVPSSHFCVSFKSVTM